MIELINLNRYSEAEPTKAVNLISNALSHEPQFFIDDMLLHLLDVLEQSISE
jgi:hypothetical protein